MKTDLEVSNSKQKCVGDESAQGFKILKGESMQKSDNKESGSKQDNALTILDNLSRALASKENNELGVKVVRNGNLYKILCLHNKYFTWLVL